MTLSVPSRWLDSLHMAAGKPRYLEAIERNAKQLAFVRDPSDRKTALCGRRGGKTTGIAGWLYDGMIRQPGTEQVYIGLTRGIARKILWDGVLARMIKEYGLPLKETTRDGQLVIRHSNGSTLWIAGCDDKREVDKFRGQAFYRVNIDEAQGFQEEVLQTLIEDAIEPALADYKGQIALTGTPSPIDVGYFHAATTGLAPGWSHGHHWDVRDNPWFALDTDVKDKRFPNRAEEFLHEGLTKCHGDEQSPTYQREYLGRWFHDAGALVYPITEANRWEPDNVEHPYGLPPGEYTYGLGIDLGFSERSTAFVLAAYRRGTGEIYLLKAYARSRLIPNALAVHVQSVRERVSRETECGLRIIVDEGGLGGGYTAQMQMLGVGCEAAEKKDKRSYQEYVAGLIRSTSLKCNFAECRELLDETRKLQFDPETGKEDERYTRHCADAMLYIVRGLFPRYNPEENEPEPGSPEWHKREAKRVRDEHIAAAKKRQAKR